MADNTITRGRLRRLAELRPDRGRVLSVFVNLDPSEFPTPASRATEMSSLISEARRQVEAVENLDRDERLELKGDVARIEELLKRPGLTAEGTRGLIVYTCTLPSTLEIVRLPHPIASGVVVGERAAIAPLVAVGAPDRWCVVLTNRRLGRIFVGDGDDLVETDQIRDEVHRQHVQGGWSQANFQRSVEKEKRDHLEHVADLLFERFKQHPFDRLVIGAAAEIPSEFQSYLHSYLRGRLAGTIQIDIESAKVDEIRNQARGLIETDARKREREILDRLAEAVGTGSRGVAGLSETLQAVNAARVQSLVVADRFRASGLWDPETEMLFASNEQPPATQNGNLTHTDNVVELAIERALEQSATVLVIHHHDDMSNFDGIGAILRF